MPSLAEQSLMLSALTGDMDRELPHSAHAFREEAMRDPDRWRWCIEEANRRNRDA